MELVDSHVHLVDPALRDNLTLHLANARAAGVTRFVANAETEADWPLLLALAEREPGVVPFLGLHPWHAAAAPPGWADRLAAALAGSRSGVGEIGLDRWREPVDTDAQELAFRAQLALAEAMRRPVAIHCLRAWGWLLELLDELRPSVPFMLHAYGGSAELVQPLAGLGAWFSFAGNALGRRAARQQAVLAAVPADRLLIETDAPALPLPGRAGTVNLPEALPAVAAGLARLIGLEPAALAAQTSANASAFLAGLEPR